MQFPSNWTEDCISDTDRLNYRRVVAAFAAAALIPGEFRLRHSGSLPLEPFSFGILSHWPGRRAWNIYRAHRPEERENRESAEIFHHTWTETSGVSRGRFLGLLKMRPGTITCAEARFCFPTGPPSRDTLSKAEAASAARFMEYLFIRFSVRTYRVSWREILAVKFEE